jgi:hypothetical protein
MPNGHPVSPEALFGQHLGDALKSTGARTQEQQQQALEWIADHYNMLSKMNPEDRKTMYGGYIFPAFGAYQPSVWGGWGEGIKRLFGVKSEHKPILPLPEGAWDVPKEMEGVKTKTPMGKRDTLTAGLKMPESRPLSFSPPPLIRPEHMEEIKKQAADLYPNDPAAQQNYIRAQVPVMSGGVGPAKSAEEEVKWGILDQAQTMIDEFRKKGATEEQAIAQLPPHLRNRYQEHREDILSRIEQRKVYTKYLTEGKLPLSEAQTKNIPLKETETERKNKADEALKKEKLEKPPATRALSAADVKALRVALLQMYLNNPDVWPNEEAHNQALTAAKAGLMDQVYYSLNEDQRRTFDQIIGKAQPYAKEKGIEESLAMALRGLQETRPGAFQRSQSPAGVKPPTGKNPPKVREKQSSYSQADLEYTAQQHGITVDEVKKQLGGR